jgi:hypothetical protein
MNRYRTSFGAKESDTVVSSRRRDARHAHAERVALCSEWGEVTGWLVDLSSGGAQVHLANGMVPMEGDDVMLRLSDGRCICATTAWIGAQTLGLAFEQPLAAIEDVLWIEQRDLRWSYGGSRGLQ